MSMEATVKTIKLATFTLVIMTFVVLVIAGCGGSGGSGTSTSGGSGDLPPVNNTTNLPPVDNTTSSAFLLYQGNSIGAVDPANPASPVSVESGITKVTSIFHGTFDPVGKKVSDIHTRTVVYVKGGQFFKASALKGTATPIPVQLANETSAPTGGAPLVAADFADHNNAQFIYLTSSGAWKMIKVGMSATDTPIPAKQPLKPVYDKSNGALAGWLAIDGSAVKRFDADFSAGSAVPVTTFADKAEAVGITFDIIFLKIDGKLYAYNTASGAISNVLYTFTATTAGDLKSTKDGSNMYFIDGGKLLSVSLSGTAPAEQIGAETGTIVQLAYTDHKVVYVLYDAGQYKIRTTGKVASGTPPVDLVTATTGDILIFIGAKGTRAYFDKVAATGVATAGTVLEDGSGRGETLNAFWAGSSFQNSFDMMSEVIPQYFIRATGITSIVDFRGGALESFDAATGNRLAQLGTIPQDIHLAGVFAGVSGSKILLEGRTITDLNTYSFVSDVFYADLTKAGSLTRVTSTPLVSEHVVPLFN